MLYLIYIHNQINEWRDLLSAPLYQMIYTDLKNRSNKGHYEINDLLPTEKKELAALYSVSTITAKNTLDLLKGRRLHPQKTSKRFSDHQ